MRDDETIRTLAPVESLISTGVAKPREGTGRAAILVESHLSFSENCMALLPEPPSASGRRLIAAHSESVHWDVLYF